MAHSSIVGGSTADRLLNCPGSFQAILALPPAAEKPSSYALEGSFAHAVMDNLLRLRKESPFPGRNLYVAASDMIGSVFLDRELTQEHLDTMIYPALSALEELEKLYGGNFDVLAVERSVDFPGIPGAHGTCDLIIGSKTHILHVDWKFGSGIQVKAVYEDSAGDIVNPQMMFYTTAAMNSAPAFYKGKKTLVAAIIQPRADISLTHTVVTRQEIKWFAQDMQNAVVKALERGPPRHKGEWCRFAPCKINCPLWTTPMLFLAEQSDVSDLDRTDMVSDAITPFGAYLASAKHLVDILTIYKKEVDEQLHAYLENGGKVPGWRLKAKTKQRKWLDDEGYVAAKLFQLGFGENEVWKLKLQTFASIDATAKRLGIEIPDELRVTPSTNETTVCRDDDPAPVVTKPLAIEQFRAALKALSHEQG